jgi:protein-S-isoprenylcysteine O-methyltransferase Ste14
MLKSFARAAGFTAYFFITLEMIFMVTPFALYYYSAYAPLLSGASSVPGLTWLPAFFLPHLSTDIVPSVGGLILLVGIGGFLIGAWQIYYAKFRKRGVVASGLYKRVRHPQYFFLGVAGLGLLIVWPRFILLIIYVNMLWFYYLLARSEEEQMRSRHADVYLEPMRGAPMFIPGEPGGHLAHVLFGWISNRKLRLSVIYCVSLVVALGGGFAFRELSLYWTTHLSFADARIAAVSLMPSARTQLQLRELVELARSDRDVQDRLNRQDGWMLIQAAEGKASATHVMIDAGMTRRQANSLPISERGIELVFLQRKDENGNNPFEAGARWQPVFIAEVNGERVSRVVDVPASLFRGNPLMPIF